MPAAWRRTFRAWGRSGLAVIYDGLLFAALLLVAPCYFWKLYRRGYWREGFGQRFGGYSPEVRRRLAGRNTVWFHAVSVGEINQCARLIDRLGTGLASWTVVVSTTTSTGMAELRRQLSRENVVPVYYPLDLVLIVERALRTIRPRLVVLLEAEIWPNFLWRLARRNVPALLINARMSERSAARYRFFGWFFRARFFQLAGVGVQNESDARLLASLGCRLERIRVTGNLKFDTVAPLDGSRIDPRPILRWAGGQDRSVYLLGSSTHAGEERLLGEIYLRLRREFPELFLVIVPRHFERSAEVERELKSLGLATRRRSGFESRPAGTGQCLVVDSTGELRSFYEAADVVVVGKSFCSHGGQNPVEAAAIGCPVLTGPNMENFRAVMNILLQRRAIVQVGGPAELETALSSLLADEEERAALGRRARQTIIENQGAVERSAELIEAHLPALSD